MHERITHDKTTQSVAITMSVEDFDALVEAVRFTVDYTSNNYGSGWDTDTDGRWARKAWQRLERRCNRYEKILPERR